MFRPNNAGELICRDLDLETIPKNLFDEQDLIFSIDLCGNQIRSVENSVILKLTNLKILDLRSNHLEALSEEIGFLWNLKELRLDSNHLMSLPLQLFQLTSLEILTVTKNSLFAIPEIISKLRKLKNLSISYNNIKHIPHSIGKLARLTEIYVQNNLFTALPMSLFKLEIQELGLEWLEYLTPSKKLLQIRRELQDFPGNYIKFFEFLSRLSVKFDSNDILFRSIFKAETGVVSGLIEAGVDVNSFDTNGYSPLMVAIKYDKSAIGRLLVEAGASFKYGAGNYGSILHISVYKSEIWLVELILSAGVDIDTIDAEGNTALHILMGIFCKQKHKNKRIGELIMSKSPKVNIHNYENWAPIHLAARKGFSSALKWVNKMNNTLLKDKEKFDLNIKGGSLDWAPLHLASHSTDFTSVEVLINAGADVSVRNLEGKSAKNTCKGNITIYKYLVRLEKMQKVLFLQGNKVEKLPVGENCTGNQVFEQYSRVWQLYQQGKFEAILESLGKDIESVVATDSLYLISSSRHRHQIEFLTEAKRRKDPLGIHESKEAACSINIQTQDKKIGHGMIGPKSKQIQPSVLCSQVLIHDEDF